MKDDQLREGEGRDLFTLKNFMILLLGFVLGYLIKGQAIQNITIGYDDYKLPQWNNIEEENIDTKIVEIDTDQNNKNEQLEIKEGEDEIKTEKNE